MKFRVFWAPVARDDLATIAQLIARDDLSAALRMLETVEKRAESLETLPRRGRAISELAILELPEELRELIIPPWRLVYRISARKVEVLGVVDARRDVEIWLQDRLLR